MRNIIGWIIRAIGIFCYAGGIILGITIGNKNGSSFFIFLASGFVSGSLLLGFSEIIFLLDKTEKIMFRMLQQQERKE